MGYIISFGYSQGAIWFYNLRAPQICFRNFWDQKIDQVETQDRCVYIWSVWPKEFLHFSRSKVIFIYCIFDRNQKIHGDLKVGNPFKEDKIGLISEEYYIK